MDSRKHSGIQPAKLWASPVTPAATQGGYSQKFTRTEEHLRNQRLKEKKKENTTLPGKIKNAKHTYPLRWLHFQHSPKTTRAPDTPLPETLPQISPGPPTASMARASASPSTCVPFPGREISKSVFPKEHRMNLSARKSSYCFQSECHLHDKIIIKVPTWKCISGMTTLFQVTFPPTCYSS